MKDNKQQEQTSWLDVKILLKTIKRPRQEQKSTTEPSAQAECSHKFKISYSTKLQLVPAGTYAHHYYCPLA